MKIIKILCIVLLVSSGNMFAQHEQQISGKTNTNKFRQLYDEFSTPNMFRTGSGAPGPAYYQQQADYVIDIELDEKNKRIYGYETITYTNNSPDNLNYLWIQLDQNRRAKDSKSPLIETSSITEAQKVSDFTKSFLKEPFDGGFNIEEVKDINGNVLAFTINRTMMRVELPETMQKGSNFSFSIKWWYNINNHVTVKGRSGYEDFPDGNSNFVIAQFYPRMAVYNDVEGWQNSQFWGRGEFALPFGNFEVNITVPSDHILDGTGRLLNREEVYSREMMKRYKLAKKSYEEPVVIVNTEEAKKASRAASKDKKTWKLYAENVRDFAFATSRRYLLDMMTVKIGDRDVMAVSLYPKEGNPLWEKWSTITVASTLLSYSRMTFDYPYHKAISVHAENLGMEYPMICFNRGRPRADGTYTDYVKYRLISLIVHEVGHNFFPMIVNSDERQWTWMDEGLNVFLELVAEQDFGERFPEVLSPEHKRYPTRRGFPNQIIPYMGGDQDYISPIMSKGLNIHQLGNNAYAKPATALNILRETVMGRELFDYAFKEYAKRWMFKHPTPEDFFRTMEDASAIDLDWYWRGWFYTTDWVDIGIKEVMKYYLSSKPNDYARSYAEQYRMPVDSLPPMVFLVEENSYEYEPIIKEGELLDKSKPLKEYLIDNFTEAERNKIKQPKYFYSITFEKPGGLVMPLIVEYNYIDGTKEKVTYPAQIWRHNDKEITKAIASEKEILSIKVDPEQETADIDESNNNWPKEIIQSKFEKFKSKSKR